MQQRRVLYVAAEGAFGFKGRIDAWETGWDILIGDDQLGILPFPVNLMNTVDVANLLAVIDWGGYSFVVLDTLARCMVGADENSARDTGIVVDRLYRLLDRTPNRRGVITGVHHTGKDGHTLRGSSAFEGGVDTVYSVTRDGVPVILDREKRKDGQVVDVHRLKFSGIEGTGSGLIEASRGDTCDHRADRLLSQFRSHFAGTGASATKLLKVTDLPFYRALSDLVQRGSLVNQGTDRQTFYEEPEAMPERLRLMVTLASWCALRFGETVELRRGDVDLSAEVIRIRRAAVRTGGAYSITTPKSDAGVRDVAIPPHVIPLIESHLAKHVDRDRDSLIFPADSGGHLQPATLYRHWYRARDAANRPDLRFHDLRHSGAVLAAATGATLAELMARLGHSTPAAAMRYQHAAAGRDREIASLLSKLADEKP